MMTRDLCTFQTFGWSAGGWTNDDVILTFTFTRTVRARNGNGNGNGTTSAGTFTSALPVLPLSTICANSEWA